MVTKYAIASRRVSTLKQQLQGDSPDDQEEQIRLRIKQLETLLDPV